MKRLVGVLLAVWAATTVFAAKTTTWRGTSGASWNVAGNWDNGIPESGDSVVLTGTDSVNDIVGLSLAGITFSGSTGIALSGEAITLTGGETAMSFEGSGAFTVATPLVLTSGDNQVTVKTGNTASFEGVISGSGRLVLLGENVYSDNLQNQWNRKTVWNSVVNLKSVNTFTGGMKSSMTTVYLSHPTSLGAEWTEVDYCGYGPLVFLEGGDINYHFVDLNNYPWFELDVLPANFNGNFSNDVSKTLLSFIHYNNTGNADTNLRNLNINGYMHLPKIPMQGGCSGVNFNMYGPVAFATLQGHSGAFGGRHHYNFMTNGNQVTTLKNSSGDSFYFFLDEVFSNRPTVDFTKIANGTTLDLQGHDQMIDRVLTGLPATDFSGNNRVFTSALPAVLKMVATADTTTGFNLKGAASMDWAPASAKTMTLLNSIFSTTGQVAVSNGKLVIGSGCSCSPEMSVAVGLSDMLDLQIDETYTVRALEVSGEPQWPDTYTFGTGRLLVTGYDAKTFAWTGNGGTTSAAEAANWGGTAPDLSGRPYVLSFASAGAEADFCADATVLGLAFDGAATAFAVRGDGTLTLNGNGVTVAADHAAAIANDVAFASVAQQIDVGEGSSLTTTGEIGSGLPLSKSGAGTWTVGGSLSLTQGLVLNGGKVVFEADASVSLTVAADAEIELADDVVLSLDSLARIGEAKLSVVAGSLGQVVSDALKGTTAPIWFTINDKRVSFGADGKAMEYDYGDGTDISAHGGAITDASVVRVASNGAGEGGVTLSGENVSVGALAQKAAADVAVSMDGGTLTAGTLARLDGAGALVIGSTAGDGTLSAKDGTLVLENRDTAADLVIRSDLAPADVAVTKIREGTAVLPGSRSWSATVTIEDGAVAFSETKPRLELSKDGPVPTVKLASDGSKLAIDNQSGSLAATGNVWQELSSFAVSDGKVTIRDGAALHMSGTASVPIAGEMVVSNAVFSLLNPESPIATESNVVQERAVNPGFGGDGVYRVCAEATVTNKLVIGSTDHVGAAYFDGGEAVLVGGDANKEFAGYTTVGNGNNAQGYLEVRDGATVRQFHSMRMEYGSANATLAVLGGSFTATYFPGQGTANSYFAFANGSGVANLFVRNGSFTCDDTIQMMDQGSGQGIITVANGGYADFQKLMRVGYAKNRDNTRGTLYNILEGGRMQFYGFTVNATLFPAYATNSVGERVYRPVYVNMNGGTVSHPYDNNYALFDHAQDGYSLLSRVTVFEKGVTFQGGKSTKFLFPFDAPTGGGVRSIPWTTRTGFIAPPSVRIDGDGYGASAYAEFDSRSGAVTNILVTSPGCDYTYATAVVLMGTTVLEEIACEVVENDRTGAFRFRGTAPSHLIGKKWGVWTVGEILLDNPIDALTVYQESDDVLSTNTVLTLKEASNTYSAWNRYSGANVHNRLQVACVRGTAGKVTGASDGFVHARRLALEGAGAIDFDGLTYRVEGAWEIDVADLIARQTAGDAVGQYNCSIVFADTARIVLKDADRIEELGGRMKLVKTVGEGHAITPSAHLLDDAILPKGWKMSVGSHGISIGPETGLLLIVR